MEQMVNIDNRISPFLKNSKNSFKNIKFGLSGIVLGLIVIAIVFYVLNYFKIINIWPASKPVVENKIQVNTQTPVKIADVTGRRTFASEDKAVNGWTDKSGWQENPITKGDSSKVTGIFISWEFIQGTKDKYITLLVKNGNNKSEATKLKVLYDTTLLNVYNLDYDPLNNKIALLERVDYLRNISIAKLYSLISMGDIVSAYIPMTESTTSGVFTLVKDETGTPVTENMEIRRFGGLDTIKKELK